MDEKNLETQRIKNILENLSIQDFKMFGLHQISYIRNFKDDKSSKYAICGADGEEVCIADSLQTAMVVSRQNDLEPVVCH